MSISQIAQSLNREVSLNAILKTSVKQVAQLLQLDTAWIWLYDTTQKTSYLAAAHNLPPAFKNNPSWMNGTCYCMDKYLKDDTKTAHNISEITCSRLKNLRDGTSGLRYHASVPLFTKEEKVGILNVVSQDKQELSDSKLSDLYLIGDLLGMAIHRARLFEQSKRTGILEERQRLAREMHDSIAQDLSAISLKLEMLSAFIESETDPVKISTLLSTIKKMTKSSIEEARRSVYDLRATPLDQSNLVEGVNYLLTQQLEGTEIQWDFQVTGTYQAMGIRQEMGLYRIVQEGITNIIKHAKASVISLNFHYLSDALRMELKDNGIGFDVSTTYKGWGVVGITERVRLLGGKLSIESGEQGTIISVTLTYD